ncbi:sensor domain-containing protein [Salinibius halmophilus]|uniref:sensor domain-containing protein n=1 Tax=Salinibius halmophilus TaxID=1853216 RepID=UPI000E666A5F|nr:GGDEF domain-containing phosphodiesterase [Salinibius halmophilus]
MFDWLVTNWDTGLALLSSVLLLALAIKYGRDRQRYSALIDNIPDLAWVKDKQGRFVMVNKAFGEIWGVSPKSLIGKTDFDLSNDQNAKQYQIDDLNIIRTGNLIRRESKSPNDLTGDYQWIDLIKAPVRARSGKIIGTAGLARDISERKQAEAKLHWLAWHDNLTELFNRAYLEKQLSNLCARNEAFYLFLIDLDNFKRINDALGHAAGDEVIVTIASRLKTIPGECFRLGGDEFVILAKASNIDHVRPLIAQAFQAPVIIRKLPFDIGFTAGEVAFPQHGVSGHSLLQAADVALYEGKRAGRGQVMQYQEDMSRQAMRQLELEQDLREALRSNQFRLVYQPQVDVQSGQLVGVEALIRWRHPEYGEISPGEFIHFAEQTGVVADIGNWVLRQAISQIKQWYQLDLPLLDVAVNASVVQFEQHGFVDSVLNMLSALPVDAAGKLHLELTESVLMNQRARKAIGKLTLAGVHVIMDDFGTGYSNLSMLSELSLSKIKFDRSLIQQVASNEAKGRICAALMALAQDLGLTVVAEGVESQADAQWLIANNCPLAQGYFFSKPLEVKEVNALLHSTPIVLPLTNRSIVSNLH